MNDMTAPEWLLRERGINRVDLSLLFLYMLGIYTGFAIQFTPTVPMPSALAGVAGLALLWRRRMSIETVHVKAFTGIVAVLLLSIFLPPDLGFLLKRFTGFVQLTYSLIIGYAVFLTMLEARRGQLARFFLVICAVIFVGCILEDYAGLRPISDWVRGRAFTDFVYEADLRDELLYGRIRPKFFTSEPSAVTFGFTLFAFIWLMVSRWRFKILAYLAMMGAGIVIMPGPTLLLMLLMLVPYQFLIGKSWTPTMVRFAALGTLAGAFVFIFLILGSSAFSNRVNQYAEGADASSFYRVQGPALVAMDVMEKYPLAGIGLTSEAYIDDEVLNVYRESGEFDPRWKYDNTFEVLTNYFWLHWIYFGAIMGVVVLVAMSRWLKSLGVQSLWFCWAVWAILGQASGSYVGPKTWAVMLMTAAGTVVARRISIESVSEPIEPSIWHDAQPGWLPLEDGTAAE